MVTTLYFHIFGDASLFLAYLFISVCLLLLWRRRRWPILALFGLFIAACGMTHFNTVLSEAARVCEVNSLWAGLTKLVAGGLSLMTVGFIVLHTPKLLALLEPLDTVANVLEAFPIPILMADDKGEIVFVNKALEQLLRYTKKEMIGQLVEPFMPERFRGQHVHHRTSFNMDPHPRAMGNRLTTMVLRKDGVEVPVEITLGPLLTAYGSYVMVSIQTPTSI